MKIINKINDEVVAEILTNHSMSLDEAIELVGSFIPQEDPWDTNVEIDGVEYFSDDLDLVF